MNNIYGYELILDLKGCDPEVISSKDKLKLYVERLCRLIRMKKYRSTLIYYFGQKKPYTKGYSLVQFIETSSITAHFSERFGSAFINIFSCKKFNEKKAAQFSKTFFKAKSLRKRLLIRTLE